MAEFACTSSRNKSFVKWGDNMTEQKKVCSVCGGENFTEGTLGNSYSNVTPADRLFSRGSSLILTFCKDCGEVSSMKVENPSKF